MSEQEKTEETREQKLARLEKEEQELAAKRKSELIDRKIERLELARRLEREFGPEGSEFAIYDSGHIGDPLIAVKRGELVQYTKYEESKQTHADRYDFVSPCIVHPSLTEYQAARQRRIGIEVEVSNRLAKLYGLKVDIDAGK